MVRLPGEVDTARACYFNQLLKEENAIFSRRRRKILHSFPAWKIVY